MPDLVYVEWWDHSAASGWYYGEPDLAPLSCHSVGWVIDEDDKVLLLAPSKSMPDPDAMQGSNLRQYIIKSAITKRCVINQEL
jgi:hypothetical protein